MPKDWRGTEIEVGQTCIYGAPVGRSIAMVQAIVEGFTVSGRVNVRPIHRSYGRSGAFGWGGGPKEIVHVGAARLTIINEGGLPPTNLKTETEIHLEAKEIYEKRRLANGSS